MAASAGCNYKWHPTLGWQLTDTCPATVACPLPNTISMAPGPGDPTEFVLACGVPFPLTTQSPDGTHAPVMGPHGPFMFIDQHHPTITIVSRAPASFPPRQYRDSPSGVWKKFP